MKGNKMSTTKSNTTSVLSAASIKRLDALAKRIVTEEGKASKSIAKSSLMIADYVAKGGKSDDLTSVYGVGKSTVSKRLAFGKALKVVGITDDETVAAIKATLEGDRGDRQALVEATRKGSSAGVVAATKKATPKGKGKKGKKDGNARIVDFSALTSEALVALLGDTLEALAGREDVATVGVPLEKFAKSANVIAKNVLAMTVA